MFLSFINLLYNHIWRNISAIYMYIYTYVYIYITRLELIEIFSQRKENKRHIFGSRSGYGFTNTLIPINYYWQRTVS